MDEAGRHIDLPTADAERATTPILDGGREVAVLVHDQALLDDAALMSAVAAAARLAVANARLQAEVRQRVAEVEASRRRIVAAAESSGSGSRESFGSARAGRSNGSPSSRRESIPSSSARSRRLASSSVSWRAASILQR